MVAMGAGVYAGIRARREDIRDMLLTDVCPFTLGVETWRKKSDLQGYLLPMIERNSTLPTSHCQRLVTMNDYQDGITVRIYQGEEYYAKDNLFLGEISIPVYPKPAGEEWIDVYFTYDINGLLYVEVANAQGIRNHILLSNQELSRSELERYRKEMQKLMIPPIQQEENKKILEELTQYYHNSVGGQREQIGLFINWFARYLHSGRRYLIVQAVEKAKQQVQFLEESQDRAEEFLFDGELNVLLEEESEEY